MRKKNFLFIVAMVFILMLSGCGKSSTSEPITTTKFKTIMEEKGLEVTDKTYKENNSAKITENENNTQSVYDVTASDYHCKVIKKENTVLYVTAYPEYKEDAEKLVKELGY